MLFFFRPFQLHRVRIHDLPQQTYLRSLFVFEPAMLDLCLQPFPSTHHFFQKLWKDPLSMQAMHNLHMDTLHPLLHTHQSYIEQANPDQLLEAQMFFLSSLMHHLKAIDSLKEPNRLYSHSSQNKTSSTAEKVMDWVEAHYMKPFELGQLAAAIHLSPNHISAVFKKSVGSSITEYLTARRIRQACWLLQTSDYTIQEIGQAVGLGNFSYFCQMFKKHVGLTPYQFKRMPRVNS
jgi:AraC family transcriptional regulator of arabinose operon